RHDPGESHPAPARRRDGRSRRVRPLQGLRAARAALSYLTASLLERELTERRGHVGEGMPGTGAWLHRSGWASSLLLDCLNGEAQLSENLDRAALSALEITGGKALPRGELVRGAQDCLRRVATFLPDELVRRRRGETVLREEFLRTQ